MNTAEGTQPPGLQPIDITTSASELGRRLNYRKDWMGQFMVGRQPIFDAKLGVHGYELLFRDPHVPGPQWRCHDGRRPGACRPRPWVGRPHRQQAGFCQRYSCFPGRRTRVPFPAGQTVVEILEDVARDPEVIAGCRRLADNGYTLALDDYLWEEKRPAARGRVHREVGRTGVDPRSAGSCRRAPPGGRRLVAEKVETRRAVRGLPRAGFDLYQGYLLSRPEVVEGQALSPNKLTCLRIIEKLCDPATSAAEVERIVQTDAALSYRFLRVAGAGAARGLFRRLSSVRDAVVMLGQRRLRAWVTLMLLQGAREGSDELLIMAMTRARMAELMARELAPDLADPAYTVGLVSALDLMLQAPLGQIMAGLSLSSQLEDAILGHTGPLGGVLADVLSWEVGGEEFQLRSAVSTVEIERCYVQALAWATEICQVLPLDA